MAGDLQAAVAAFEQREPDPGDLLYLLERGHLLRIADRYAESNEVFESAELRIEELYTKSISREAFALITTDNLLPYRGLPYEVQFVHYYRALNYLDLGQLDEALVEARKANFKLAEYAEKTAEDAEAGDGALRQDAFLHYFTGLLYQAAGDGNDALVSYRNAAQLYATYESEYGQSAPASLWENFYATALRLGSSEEVRPLVDSNPDLPRHAAAAAESNVVLFLESGFAPYRESVDIWLPILERGRNDRDDWLYANRYVSTYGHRIYAYRQPSRLSHVLRFAFPRMVEVPPRVMRAEVAIEAAGDAEAGDGRAPLAVGERAINLATVAQAEFDDHLPRILVRTLIRAIAKEATRASLGRENEALGAIANVLGVVSEQADTRGWILLPGRIDVVQTKLPPGEQQLHVRFLTGGGAVVREETVSIVVPPRGTVFRAVRCYQ